MLGCCCIASISVIAITNSTITSLKVDVFLEMFVPGGSFMLRYTVLHQSSIFWLLCTHPTSSVPVLVSKFISSFIDSKWCKINLGRILPLILLYNLFWIVSFVTPHKLECIDLKLFLDYFDFQFDLKLTSDRSGNDSVLGLA